MTDEERKQKVEEAKKRGNDFFKANNYARAMAEYTEAIDIADGDDAGESLDSLDEPAAPLDGSVRAVLYSNRAFCHIKMENMGSAILDGTKGVEADESYSKAWYRRGSACMALGRYKEALRDLTQVCKITPNDRDARVKLQECKKQIQQEKFAKAIQSEKTKALSETVDVGAMRLDDSYDGPVYKSGDVTPEFCKELMEYQRQQKNIAKKCAYAMVLDMIALLRHLSSLVDVSIPPGGEFTVCGDVHGQYYDLLNIWEMNGVPAEDNPYLFNGDFVDRGSFSLEVIMILFAWKLCYPNHVHLSRGNHETINMNKLYGFQGEVVKKYDDDLYGLFKESFCLLPLAHCIQNKIFVTHGGLFSKDDVTLDDIRKVDRDQEPPDEGIMTEMLWSDPQPGRGRSPSKRGVGVAFGQDVTENFLKTNDLKLVVRSHEMKEEGYEVDHSGKLITVFSAPNYCDQMGNKGAFIRFDAETVTPKFTSFKAVPHPPVRPMQYANPMLGQMFGF